MNDANLNEILVVKQRDSIVRLKAKVTELEAELTEQKIRSTIAEGENSKLRERNTQLNTAVRYAKQHATKEDNCEHDWVDARNPVVKSGEICIKCFAIKAGNKEDNHK